MEMVFHKYYYAFRAIALTALIMIAGLKCATGNAKSVDMHVRVPGGEEDRNERHNKEKENEKAYKRENENRKNGKETSKSDQKKSTEHYKKMIKNN